MSRKKVNISELNLKKVGGRIAYIRIKEGLNQEQFGKNIGLSKSNISCFENHKYEPSFQVIVKILEHYKINSDWLLFEHGDPYIKVGERGKGAECDTCIYKVGETAGEDPEIVKLLEMVNKVLKSGADRAETLTVNIWSSHQAMIKDREMENRLAALEQVAHPPNKVSKIIREGDDEAQRGEILKKRRA